MDGHDDARIQSRDELINLPEPQEMAGIIDGDNQHIYSTDCLHASTGEFGSVVAEMAEANATDIDHEHGVRQVVGTCVAVLNSLDEELATASLSRGTDDLWLASDALGRVVIEMLVGNQNEIRFHSRTRPRGHGRKNQRHFELG